MESLKLNSEERRSAPSKAEDATRTEFFKGTAALNEEERGDQSPPNSTI
jgi:hypothetical protein